ncbi:MAG: molybdopterin synthase sulfur carrier subunit [Desulfarculus sp.]|nr:MAG: molybdopterin synthase sulfur carrier subunit [Desulfarculus sp.]
MPVRVTAVGALLQSLPSGKTELPAEGLTVQELLEALLQRYGEPMKQDLICNGELRQGLCLLLNGRNVLVLPERFDTRLRDGDELIIATILAGG